MAEGIKDRIAIIGMGCSQFGEHWDKDDRSLIIDACYEAFEDAGVEPKDIQAAWLSTVFGRHMGVTLTQALKMYHVPTTRIENMCASGADAFRNASYAVAAGIYDIALVCGVEKLKDTGLGLFGSPFELPFSSWVDPFAIHTPASYEALVATRYFHQYGLTYEEGKRLLAMVAVKNHHNGTLTPKAHLRREITIEDALRARIICWPLGLYDACGQTDGAAAAIITRPDLAKKFRDDYVMLKAVQISTGAVWFAHFDFFHIEDAVVASKRAYAEAGIENPRQELDMAEVHDAFTILELVFAEDLGFSPRGQAKVDVEAGNFTLEGDLPMNADGGLKCFGHPLGATGIRMLYELYKQIQGKAGEHQLKNVDLALAQNMGGAPWSNATSVTILGSRD